MFDDPAFVDDLKRARCSPGLVKRAELIMTALRLLQTDDIRTGPVSQTVSALRQHRAEKKRGPAPLLQDEVERLIEQLLRDRGPINTGSRLSDGSLWNKSRLVDAVLERIGDRLGPSTIHSRVSSYLDQMSKVSRVSRERTPDAA